MAWTNPEPGVVEFNSELIAFRILEIILHEILSWVEATSWDHSKQWFRLHGNTDEVATGHPTIDN